MADFRRGIWIGWDTEPYLVWRVTLSLMTPGRKMCTPIVMELGMN